MVYRIYVEKKPELDNEARSLLNDARSLLGIQTLETVRLFNRYDVEGISRKLFDYAVRTVFSEPQLDLVYDEPALTDASVFAVEYLPGQFDQRADSVLRRRPQPSELASGKESGGLLVFRGDAGIHDAVLFRPSGEGRFMDWIL